MSLLLGSADAQSSGNFAPTDMALPEPVYYVFSPQDDTVLVGLDVVVRKTGDSWNVVWWDPTHERYMGASKITYNSDFFAFRRSERDGRSDGRLYFFIPMDLDIYRGRVRRHLCAAPDFETKEEMIQAFRDAASEY